MKYKKLTEAQLAKVPSYRDKWTEVGLALNDTTNEALASEAIKQVYKDDNKTPPKHIVFARSPKECLYYAAHGFDLWNKKLPLIITQETKEKVESRSPETLALFKKYITSDIKSNFGFGNHDATWLGFYDFFRNEAGYVAETDCIQGLIEFSKHANWFLPFSEIVFISAKPIRYSRDARGRLHSTNHLAIEYSDGWGCAVIHGIKVEDGIVLDTKNTLTIERIEKERNAEMKRVLIELYGKDKYIIDSGATLLDKSTWGELYSKEIANDEPLVMVKVLNSTPEPDGSIKEYWLRVDPHCRPMIGVLETDGVKTPIYGKQQALTALNAIASTFGECGEDYAKYLIKQT